MRSLLPFFSWEDECLALAMRQEEISPCPLKRPIPRAANFICDAPETAIQFFAIRKGYKV